MPKKKRASKSTDADTPALFSNLDQLSAEQQRIRAEIEAAQRAIEQAPMVAEQLRRKEVERVQARAAAERDTGIDRPHVLAGQRSPGPRRAVRLKVEQRAIKQQTWALIVFLLIVIFMLWSAMS
ncbi:hypothetical protein AYO41_01195 [Verrucomicrobia bacterium SCGC AG-212-E04]|nr:hypothetical protein AYO41_01195 [Verrucomicrobia bacterium SCGC AG-212-E04]